MPVVSFACLLLTPIQSLTRKPIEEKPALSREEQLMMPTSSDAKLDEILPAETRAKNKASNSTELQETEKYQGSLGHSTSAKYIPSARPPDSLASKSAPKPRISDFDKLSMSVEQSIEEVKSPLTEQQGYFPNILTPSTYVHLQPSQKQINHAAHSRDKTRGTKPLKSNKRPTNGETQYFPSPTPQLPDVNPFQVIPENEGNVRYVYPSNRPGSYPLTSPNDGLFVTGVEPGVAFGMRERPKMAPSKVRQNSIKLRYRDTPEEEAMLRIPDFDDESQENAESSSSEHRYQPEALEEPEEETEAEAEGETLEDDDGESIKYPEPLSVYPKSIKTTKEVIKTGGQGPKGPPRYVENTVRHHEFSIKNTYPTSGSSTQKLAPEIPSLEVMKPIIQGPLLRAPSSGVPSSARLTPYYSIYPLKPSVLNIRPIGRVKPKKEITIVVRNRHEPIFLGRPPRLGTAAAEVHHHKHRHIVPSAQQCALCLTKQPLKQNALYVYPRSKLPKALRSQLKPYGSPKLNKQIGCASPYHNGHYHVNPSFNYKYNYPHMRVPKYISTYPVYFPRLNLNQMVTPYKTALNPPETYARYHYYMKFPHVGAQVVKGASKSPADYQVHESEENVSDGPAPGSQEEYGGTDDDEEDVRQEIDTDYEHVKYRDGQHFKPKDESRLTETYTDYGPNEEESMIQSSKFPRRPRSPYLYSHQIHYF